MFFSLLILMNYTRCNGKNDLFFTFFFNLKLFFLLSNSFLNFCIFHKEEDEKRMAIIFKAFSVNYTMPTQRN